MIVAAMMVFSANVLAEYVVEHNKSVSSLGVQGNNAYMAIENGYARDCSYNNIYFDITTDFGKVAYSTILAAKARGVELFRIDYEYSGSSCSLKIVELRD